MKHTVNTSSLRVQSNQLNVSLCASRSDLRRLLQPTPSSRNSQVCSIKPLRPFINAGPHAPFGSKYTAKHRPRFRADFLSQFILHRRPARQSARTSPDPTQRSPPVASRTPNTHSDRIFLLVFAKLLLLDGGANTSRVSEHFIYSHIMTEASSQASSNRPRRVCDLADCQTLGGRCCCARMHEPSAD